VVTNPALQGRCSSRGGRAPKVQAWDPVYTVRQPSRHMRERFRSVFHSLSARRRPTPINGKNLSDGLQPREDGNEMPDSHGINLLPKSLEETQQKQELS